MAENPFEKYRNMLPSGKIVGELPPETQTPDASAADTADVPGGGALPQVQPQPGSVAASGPAWRAAAPTVVSGNAPGYRQSETLPLARREDVINDPNSRWYQGWALAPGGARAVTQTPAENTTINPNTGTMNIAPEALAAASMLGGVRVGRAPEIQPTSPSYVPPGTLNRRAPLSPEFIQNPLGPSLTGREMPTPSGPTSSTGVPPQAPMPEMRAVPRPTEGQGVQPSGGRSTTVAAPGSDEAILAHAESVADQHYGVARAAGQDSTYTPQSVGKMVDAVDRTAPQGPGERAVGGENAVTRLQTGMQQLRDKSLTLADVQRMDERMSDLITEEYRAGRNKVAKQLEDIQQDWREQADTATAADVTGGEAGFHALSQGRGAWTQVRKMRDVINMKERAAMTENPTTSYKTAVKNYTTGRASRGWTTEEKADLVASAERGVIGSTLHLLGSRLLPHVGGAVGASVGGIPGFITGEVVTHGLGGTARTAANAMQAGRINRVMGTLGGSVPAPPTNELLLR